MGYNKIGDNMRALITGASSGIGREMAYYLGTLGYDLILVARRKKELEKIKKQIPTNVEIYAYDLQKTENVFQLYQQVKEKKIDFLINNAGFGLFGEFDKTDLERELEMIDLNIKTYHILTKLFLKDFQDRQSGRILNVASASGFLSGPRLSTYYATKNYVAKLSLAIHEELRHQKSKVHISVLCPGPVSTEFNQVAHGIFHIPSISAKKVARYAIDKSLKNKVIIIPSLATKLGLFFNRFISWSLSAKIIYHIQERKNV